MTKATWAALALLATVVSGCASRHEAWRDAGGAQIGTVEVRSLDGGGEERRYTDTATRLRRIERRDAADQCPEGICAIVFAYDDGGARRERRYEAADGALVNSADGYALTRYERTADQMTCTFISASGDAAARGDAAHRIILHPTAPAGRNERTEYRGLSDEILRVRVERYRDQRLVEVRFETPDGKPSPGRFRGETVAAVRYDYVKGVNDIDLVAEHYLSPEGPTLKTLFYKGATPAEDPCT
ncbi:MAG: hypothetical protein SF182_13775 [Deltaproteobacteria bacterium]|nr:hypothetical protein [Deltaproteobacteria bacterium]